MQVGGASHTAQGVDGVEVFDERDVKMSLTG